MESQSGLKSITDTPKGCIYLHSSVHLEFCFADLLFYIDNVLILFKEYLELHFRNHSINVHVQVMTCYAVRCIDVF